MADDKKNIPEAAPPAEAPAPAVENTAVPEQPSPEPALTDAEAVMLEHEGQAALFEMGEAVPDPADAVTHAEVEEPAAPEAPKAEMEQAQPPDPGKDAPAPAHSGKVVDFAAARDEAAKEEKKAVKQKPSSEKGKAAKPGKGRPPKTEKTAPEQTKPPKAGKTHAAPVEKAAPHAPEVPPTPRDATRAEKEEIVYLDLSDLHPFKDHPFGVRDDAEMKSLVESVRNGGVNQPALVRPREGGGYEIIAGHRRQMASQLAGYRNMPCIVRNMTDDEAILAMTDDNLRQRETILPSEKAMSLKMQYEAIKHQGARGDSADRADGGGPARDERGAAETRRFHHLHGDGLEVWLFELLRGAGRERGQLLAAVDGLAQERELLLHGLDLFFASHIWFLPVMNWLFKAKPARR